MNPASGLRSPLHRVMGDITWIFHGGSLIR